MRVFVSASLTFIVLVVCSFIPNAARCDEKVDFARDVRPVLSTHCFKCHGRDEDKRQAGLRLDMRDSATSAVDSGTVPIVPGKPDESELVRRIFSDDESEMMPPPDAKNPLTDEQKEILKRWIGQGAEYKPHWAFQPITRPPVPAVKDNAWPKNDVDRFILARLEAAGLAPNPPADRYTLVRRVYLDLIGIPPTVEEADQFVNDPAPDAYERLVDRLLVSPHYGERWARRWLDLARYADTNGYEKDRTRSTWPYRDWVIHALNSDMPFDQFTIEQLAGDMLPNAAVEQKIATGFHRNTMINEEGGIDPQEFRYYAIVDRTNTTGTVWLGLTVGCAQCHSHKFDPIAQREYYQLMAFLNNADEPVMSIPDPQLVARRQAIEKEAGALEADLANHFPPEDMLAWQVAHPTSVTSAGGATPEVLDDDSVRWSGTSPERDTYTFVTDSQQSRVTHVRLEAVSDPMLPSKGPGRTPHGNFVLSEFTISVAPLSDPAASRPVKLASATADFSQEGFPAVNSIDGDTKTGWAIHGPDPWNVTRTITFSLAEPIDIAGGARWTITLDQQHGTGHTIGGMRISLGEMRADERSVEARRRENLENKFNAWLEAQRKDAVQWTVLPPTSVASNMPKLEVLDDGSVLASGDQSKRDEYYLDLRGDLRGVSAIRLEVLPDERLPQGGPGRVYYEGAFGDFFLSEVTAHAGDQKFAFAAASQSFANGGNTAAQAIDGDPQTGWSIGNEHGRSHIAVFRFAQPLATDELELDLLFERYYAAGLGRFRVSVTKDPRAIETHGQPAEIESLLLRAPADCSPEDQQKLRHQFLATCPELAADRTKIQNLRSQMPDLPTSLVLHERPDNNPRATYIHQRGEFLRLKDSVEANVPEFLPQMTTQTAHNRLNFARWLVDSRNPLTARVVVNRHWATIFGRGIVRTVEDFGFQGELPTHPELLDWLASEFMQQGWSIKQLHRLIVTSATYQQSSQVSPASLERDPNIELLARAPRNRLDAELLRDQALCVSGLLSEKIGGPSVFPPQPPGITSEGTYGPLQWMASTGADRYRRGLYTFMKRTAPYAMFATFDGPSGEACLPRREISNSPLQSLTLLNDEVFVEAARSLGRLAVDTPLGDDRARAEFIFRRCTIRPPTNVELDMLIRFYEAQKTRLAAGQIDAGALNGSGDDAQKLERAAWTLVARAVLNLDETICKN